MNYAQDFCNAFEAICYAIDSINSEFYKNRLIQFNNYLCELKKIHTEAIENKIDLKIIKTFAEKIKQYETGFDDLKAQNTPLDSEINQNYLKGNLLKASERFLGGLGIFSSSKLFRKFKKIKLRCFCSLSGYFFLAFESMQL
jgi:hypothetical protein